jgi:hypothetical protein
MKSLFIILAALSSVSSFAAPVLALRCSGGNPNMNDVQVAYVDFTRARVNSVYVYKKDIVRGQKINWTGLVDAQFSLLNQPNPEYAVYRGISNPIAQGYTENVRMILRTEDLNAPLNSTIEMRLNYTMMGDDRNARFSTLFSCKVL